MFTSEPWPSGCLGRVGEGKRQGLQPSHQDPDISTVQRGREEPWKEAEKEWAEAKTEERVPQRETDLGASALPTIRAQPGETGGR